MSYNDQWNQSAQSVVSKCHSLVLLLLFVFGSAFNFAVKQGLHPKPTLKEWARIRSTFCLFIRVKNIKTIFCSQSNWHLILHCVASCLLDVSDSGQPCTFVMLECPLLKNLAATPSDDEPSLLQTTLLTQSSWVLHLMGFSLICLNLQKEELHPRQDDG